jgi:hypothetical protein
MERPMRLSVESLRNPESLDAIPRTIGHEPAREALTRHALRASPHSDRRCSALDGDRISIPDRKEVAVAEFLGGTLSEHRMN